MANTIGQAVASILQRSITSTVRTIRWEEVVDEAGVPIRLVDSFDWSNDPVSTPDARAWLDAGWILVSADPNTESVTFRRNDGAFRFVGEGSGLPEIPSN